MNYKVCIPRVVAILFLSLVFIQLFPMSFSKNNIAVLRLGDGSTGLSNAGVAVFIDEYTQDGDSVQTISIPTVGVGANRRLVMSGTATTEGLLTLSADRQYLSFIGYDAGVGEKNGSGSISTSTASSKNRVVGIVDANGNVNTSTALTDFSSGSNARSAVTVDGNNIWVAGASTGVAYTTLGSTTSVPLTKSQTNVRSVSVFNQQLYLASGVGTSRLAAVGSGLPSSGDQQINVLDGIPTSAISPCNLLLFDLSPDVPGVDVLYYTDDNSATKGIVKYCYVNGTWMKTGGLSTELMRGLAGRINEQGNIALYAVTNSNSVIRMIDSSGYNGTMSAQPQMLLKGKSNTTLRGIAFAPEKNLIATTTSKSSAETEAISVAQNEIHYKATTEGEAHIYSLQGNLVQVFQCKEGLNIIPFNSNGVFILKKDRSCVKIVMP
jgi:hypothetical protein